MIGDSRRRVVLQLDGIHADHNDRLAFDVETEVGKASRWNTLRAMRVLDWAGT